MSPVLITLVILGFFALFVVAVRALDRAERQVAQIYRDELDDPDPFNERVTGRANPTDNTGETR